MGEIKKEDGKQRERKRDRQREMAEKWKGGGQGGVGWRSEKHQKRQVY